MMETINVNGHTLHHDQEGRSLYIDVEEGYQAKVTYRQDGKTWHLVHSEVPPALRGKGVGAVMMEATLGFMRERGLMAVPVCSYIVHYMDKHPEWDDLRG
ncbi:N-acetyltransferase [Parasalinivibrio latis]|uniref:GNAT family N-acetyltransferase n=1 Tax=Parasalinivibrio latis TaxID=2952610 RepID=UPI0030DEED1E